MGICLVRGYGLWDFCLLVSFIWVLRSGLKSR